MGSKPKILITGGAGYIGSHTAIELLESGKYEVISVDNFSNSDEKRIERVQKITGKILQNYVVDVCDANALRGIFEQHSDIEGVIHFAAYMSVAESVANPLKYYHNNLVSLINILACCEAYKVKHFVFSSSCSVYGNVAQLPVTEATPLVKAESPYANTKLISEQMLHDFCKNVPINCIFLRYFNPVGAHISGLNGEYPSNKPNNLLPIVVEVAAGVRKQMTIFGADLPTFDGTCVRDYIHVTDVATAHILALDYLSAGKNEEKLEIFNLGTGKGVSVKQIVESFERVNNLKLNYEYGPARAGDVVAVYADCTKATEKLGWTPQYDMEAMMASAWKWQQQLISEK